MVISMLDGGIFEKLFSNIRHYILDCFLFENDEKKDQNFLILDYGKILLHSLLTYISVTENVNWVLIAKYYRTTY